MNRLMKLNLKLLEGKSKMKFKKGDLQSLAWDDAPKGFEIIENEVFETGRWCIHYELIFKFDGKFYITDYSKGATEYQDESPFEYEKDEIECEEVFPVETKVIVYKTKEALEALEK